VKTGDRFLPDTSGCRRYLLVCFEHGGRIGRRPRRGGRLGGKGSSGFMLDLVFGQIPNSGPVAAWLERISHFGKTVSDTV